MSVSINQANKQLVWAFWQELESAEPDTEAVVQQYVHPQCRWHGPDPINGFTGTEGFINEFWRPLLTAIPDLSRQCHVFFGGKSSGRIDGRYWFAIRAPSNRSALASGTMRITTPP